MKQSVKEIREALKRVLDSLEPYPEEYFFDVNVEVSDPALELGEVYDIDLSKVEVNHETIEVVFKN